MIHVITAVHNRYSITEKFADRLLAQTYKDIHLILVDDGSTDSTADMEYVVGRSAARRV